MDFLKQTELLEKAKKRLEWIETIEVDDDTKVDRISFLKNTVQTLEAEIKMATNIVNTKKQSS